MEVAQVAGECSIEQRTTVHSGVNKEAEQNAGNRNKVVNSIPPTDGWANEMNESGVGAVLEVFCGTPTEGLARMVSNSQVCSK